MITAKNIVHHELIGLNVRVVKINQDSLNLDGIVIDETKNTIKIENRKFQEKIIPKKGSIFQFTIPDGKVIEINGNILSFRPEDRIKKRFKKI